jgi:hypothetical protein
VQGSAIACASSMRRAHVPAGSGAARGRGSACVLVLAVLGLMASGVRAQRLGTHPHRKRTR